MLFVYLKTPDVRLKGRRTDTGTGEHTHLNVNHCKSILKVDQVNVKFIVHITSELLKTYIPKSIRNVALSFGLT